MQDSNDWGIERPSRSSGPRCAQQRGLELDGSRESDLRTLMRRCA
jgi:hypothetical protein